MNLIFSFSLSFVALSGLGVVFLNSESILAVCFFIFFACLLQNATSAGESLSQTRRAIQSELVSCMLDAQKHNAAQKQVSLFQKMQLLKCLSSLKS